MVAGLRVRIEDAIDDHHSKMMYVGHGSIHPSLGRLQTERKQSLETKISWSFGMVFTLELHN